MGEDRRLLKGVRLPKGSARSTLGRAHRIRIPKTLDELARDVKNKGSFRDGAKDRQYKRNYRIR